jgi:hypothetical protein
LIAVSVPTVDFVQGSRVQVEDLFLELGASAMPTTRRSISEIMYSEEELGVVLLQPPLFKPVFPEDQEQ